MKRFLSAGECMIEMAGGDSGQYQQGFAGDTLNTAYYAKKLLGSDWRVDYFTALGDDLYSDRMLAFFDRHGIGTDAIQRIKGKRPGLYMIHQADGDRHFTYWRDNSAARMMADDKGALETAFAGADLIYFSGITLAILAPDGRARLLAALASARAKGTKTAFDPNIRPVLWPETGVLRNALTDAAAVADFILPTHDDERPIFGDRTAKETAERYLRAGAKEVVVKNGADPALIFTADGMVEVPATRVDTVVDATGAGDSFNGAYLSARLNDIGMEAAGAAAHAMAARVIQHRGALLPD